MEMKPETAEKARLKLQAELSEMPFENIVKVPHHGGWNWEDIRRQELEIAKGSQ